MGFLDRFRSLANDAKSYAATLAADFQNKDYRNATLAAMALTAGADGEVEPEERAKIVGFVKNGALFEGCDRATLATQMEGYLAKSTCDLQREDLFDVVAKLKADKEKGAKLLAFSVSIAKADGEFEDEEREIIVAMAGKLGIDAKTVKGLAA